MANQSGANAPKKSIVNPLDDTPCPRCKDCSEPFAYREKVIVDAKGFRKYLGQTLCSTCIRDLEDFSGVINA